MSADPQKGGLSSTSKTTPNLHPKWPIFDVFLLIPRGHIYSDLELGQFRGQGKFWLGKKFKDRFFIG